MRTALCALLFVFACGGGGSGNGDDDDVPSDGPNNPTTDGPTSTDGPPGAVSALGTTCTPDAANPQGTCPMGFECLNLQGATNPWCSKTCTQGAGDMCAAGYSGSGKASCVLTVTDENNQNPRNFCSVICQDMTADPPNQLCAAGQCNGTCPGSLACSGDLQVSINGGPPMVLGQVCE